MSEHIETELKLTVNSPSTLKKIFNSSILEQKTRLGSVAKDYLEARYFDTKSQSLRNAGLAYRVRYENGQWVATVKKAAEITGGLHQRYEWNVTTDGAEPNIAVFGHLDIGSELCDAVGKETLSPILITAFERQTRLVEMSDGSLIEVAADYGKISAESTGRSEPILEVELELKSGRAGSLPELGAELARKYPLRLEARSKYFRGLQVAGLADKAAYEPYNQYMPSKTTPVKEGMSRLLIHFIQQLLAAQDQFIADPAEVENLHQLRVALRRLRSLLSFARPLMVEDEYRIHQTALRDWGRGLGPLREIDVMLAAWVEMVESGVVTDNQYVAFKKKLMDRRRVIAQQLHNLLSDGQLTPIVLAFWARLIDGAWDQAIGGQLFYQFARRRQVKWIKQLLKVGKVVAVTDGAALHSLRIRGKRVRYSLDWLSDLLDGKQEAIELVAHIKALQDRLGDLQDNRVMSATLYEMANQPSTAKSVSYEMGLLAGWQGCRAMFVQDAFRANWRRVEKVARKWLKRQQN